MPSVTDNILEALAGDPDAVVKIVGRRMTELLASEEAAPGALLLLPIKDRAPDMALSSSFSQLIPWDETDRYRLLAVRQADGLELLLTYD